MVTVFHDYALIVLPTGLMIDAFALTVDVAFDRTSRVQRRGAFLDAHRLGRRIDFSETHLKFRGSYRITQNDEIVILLLQPAWTEVRGPSAKQSTIDRVSFQV